MRFQELLNKENPATMPEGKFQQLVNGWLIRLASWHYRRDTRIEHVQQALDQTYTALERHLKTTSAAQVTTHARWVCLVKLIAKHFPGECEVYHPTPVEQQRKLMLIRNSIATGIIKDKRRLLKEFMSHNEYKVKTLTELAHSRIKLQILAASSSAVLGRYNASIYDGWETWYRWANRRDIGCEADNTHKVEEKSWAHGQVTARGEANALIGRNFSYDSKDSKGPWRHRVEAGGAGFVQGSGEATASYDRESLNVAAAAGMEAEIGMRGDVEVQTEYAFAVTSDDFRRVFGPRFQVIQAKAGAHGKISAGGTASVMARANLTGVAGARHEKLYGVLEDEEHNEWQEAGNAGARGQAEARIWIGFTATGNAELTLAQALELGISGEILAGGRAQAEGGFFVEAGGFRVGAGAEVFAGFEAAVEERIVIKHPKRKLEIFSVKGTQAFTVGVGVGAGAEITAGIERFKIKAESQTTVGVGGRLTTNLGLSPLALGLAAYDMAIVPVLWKINRKLKQSPYTKNSSFAQGMDYVVKGIDKMADYSEVRSLARDCEATIEACLSSLDSEADHLLTMTPRSAGHDYGKSPDEKSVEGWEGHSQSSFYTYDKKTERKTGIDEQGLADAFAKLNMTADSWYKGATDATMRKPVDIKLLTKTVNTDTNYDWLFAKFAATDRRFGTAAP